MSNFFREHKKGMDPVGRRPWRDTERTVCETQTGNRLCEPKEEIDKCINCPLPAERCFGAGACYFIRPDGSLKVRSRTDKKYDEEKLIELSEEGLTIREIADAFGVQRDTVVKWKRNLRKKMERK